MKSPSANPGVIHPDELYTLPEICKRLSVGASTLRSARRQGLKVHYIHRLAFIRGKDFIDYVQEASERKTEASFKAGFQSWSPSNKIDLKTGQVS